MDVLIAAAALTVAGCYDPSLRDCTVSCSITDDCAGGQVCGADHLCASSDIAGHCGSVAPVDARPPADAAADAVAHLVPLHVKVDGNGSVALGGGVSCPKDCMLQVPAGAPATLRAVQTDPMFEFTQWTSVACAGQGAVCTIIPVVPTEVRARFDKQD